MIKSDNEKALMEYEEEVRNYPIKVKHEKEEKKKEYKILCEKRWKKEKSMRKSRKEIDRETYIKRKEEIKRINFIRKTYRWKRREKWAKKMEDCTFLNDWFEGCERHHINSVNIVCIPKNLHRSVSHNLKTGKGMGIINDLAFEWLDLQS